MRGENGGWREGKGRRTEAEERRERIRGREVGAGAAKERENNGLEF